MLHTGVIMSSSEKRRASRSERSERSEARQPVASSSPLRPSRPWVSGNPAGSILIARTVAGAGIAEPVFTRKGVRMMEEFGGIDVSKDWLDVHLLTGGQADRVENSSEACQALARRLSALPMTRIVVEATGGYERVLVAELAAAKLPVVVVNPRQVRDFAKALGRLAKTDKIDAAVLAHFASAVRPTLRPLPDETEQQLRETLNRRSQLVGMRTMESNRLKQAHSMKVRRNVESVLAFLDKQLNAIEEELDQCIRQSPAWQPAADGSRCGRPDGPSPGR